MENTKEDKSLELFNAKYIKELEGDVPSFNFTDTVMDFILKEELENAKIFEYTPLISKRVWVLLSIPFVCAILYLISLSSSVTFFDLDIKLTFPEFTLFDAFKTLSITNSTLYFISFFVVLTLSQVYFLKKRFEKVIRI